MRRFLELRQTCIACPSQWEGILQNGKHVYIRYRWGILQFGIGGNGDTAAANTGSPLRIGGNLDGELSTQDMLKHLNLNPPLPPPQEGTDVAQRTSR